MESTRKAQIMWSINKHFDIWCTEWFWINIASEQCKNTFVLWFSSSIRATSPHSVGQKLVRLVIFGLFTVLWMIPTCSQKYGAPALYLPYNKSPTLAKNINLNGCGRNTTTSARTQFRRLTFPLKIFSFIHTLCSCCTEKIEKRKEKLSQR